jgi:hypothetical protein
MKAPSPGLFFEPEKRGRKKGSEPFYFCGGKKGSEPFYFCGGGKGL